jgi:O-antigen ligase
MAGPDFRWLREIGVGLVAGLLCFLVNALSDSSSIVNIAVAGGVAVGTVALIVTDRYHVSLGVFAVYLGLVDGFIRNRTGNADLTLARDLLLYAIAAGAVIRFAVTHSRFSPPPVFGWVAAWAVLVVVQLFNPTGGTFLHSLQGLRPHVEFVPLFLFGFHIIRTPSDFRAFFLLLLIVTGINGCVALVQLQLTPQQLAAWGPGYATKVEGDGAVGGVAPRIYVDANGERRNRPPGLGSDAGFAGILGVLAVAGGIALCMLSRGRRFALLAVPLLGGLVLAVATSQSRTAVVASFISASAFVLMVLASTRRIRIVVAVAAVSLVGTYSVNAIVGREGSSSFSRYESISPDQVIGTAIDYRQSNFGIAEQYIRSWPLGAGLGTVGPGAATSGGSGLSLNGEGQFLYLLVETGIPGMVLFYSLHLLILGVLITRVRKVRDPDLRVMIAATGAPMFALFFGGFGGAFSGGSPTAPYFWFATGVLAYWLLGPGYAEQTRGRATR